MNHAWLLALAGVLSMLPALVPLASPAAGLMAAVWVIGAYAILYGVLMFYVAFRSRQLTTLIENVREF